MTIFAHVVFFNTIFAYVPILDEFWEAHPIVALTVIISLFTIVGCVDYRTGAKPLAYCWKWFVATVAAAYCIGEYSLLPAYLGWLIAAGVFTLGAYVIWLLTLKQGSRR